MNGLLLAGGGVLVVAATLWYRRLLPAARAREQARQAEQLAALKQQISLTGAPIAVHASHGILFLVLLAIVAVFFARTAIVTLSVATIGVAAFAAILTLGFALIYVPRIGKPALTIRRDGIEVPVLGFFPWDEIESVGLRKYTTRGRTSHSLDFYVPQLHTRAGRLHPLLRFARGAFLRGGGSNFVVIHLHSPSLPVAVVNTLCYDLWKQRTGRSKTWTSVLSQADIQEFERMDEQIEMLKRAGELAETDPAEAMRRMDEIEKRFGHPTTPQPVPGKRLSAALLAELKTIDPRDPEATRKVIEKHVHAQMRATTTKLVIIIVALGVLLFLWLTLRAA